jgi:hypothetical protein
VECQFLLPIETKAATHKTTAVSIEKSSNKNKKGLFALLSIVVLIVIVVAIATLK